MQPVHSIVQLRDATSDDAPFIARVVLAGIDMLDIDAKLPDEQRAIYEHLMDICSMDDTLYSYLNTRIAEVDGNRVGALVAYDGARYAALRAIRWSSLCCLARQDLRPRPTIIRHGLEPQRDGNRFG